MDIEARVYAILVTELGVIEADVIPTAKIIDDLGADSLDIPAIALELEEEFDIVIDDPDLDGVETVQQLVDLVQRKVDAAAGKVPT